MRHSISHWFPMFPVAVLAGAFIALTMASDAWAGKFKVLHSFCGPKDGCKPEGGLVMDQVGNFFGTTSAGGNKNGGLGTVYELIRTGTGKLKYKRIFSFCAPFGECDPPGSNPIGNLIVDTQGNLYGLFRSGAGAIFELSPPPAGSSKWTEKILYNFCAQQGCSDGSLPRAGLTYFGQASGAQYDGTSPLYGITQIGGLNDAGAVYELKGDGGQWTETVLYNFCSSGGDKCTDGAGPVGGIIMDEAGNLYGTTFEGGANNLGAVFELSSSQRSSWTESALYSFCSVKNCSDGAFPVGTLARDVNGNLFGVTTAGGNRCKPDPSGCGVAFRIIPNGSNSQESVLYAFCSKRDCRDGHGPEGGLLIDSSGNLFGTTSFGGSNDTDVNDLGGGVAFEFSAPSYKVLHSFCASSNCGDGEYPLAGLSADTSGHLYGTTSLGGAFGTSADGGTFFELIPK